MVGCCGQGGRVQNVNTGSDRRGAIQDDVEFADRQWIAVNREAPLAGVGGGGGGIVCVCEVQGGTPQLNPVQSNVRSRAVDARNVQGAGAAKRCVTQPHDEEVCHGTNERRRDLIGQVKIFLDDFDERPCQATPPKAAGGGGLRPLGEYEEYMRKHCQSWMPPNPRPPLITSVATHEVRPTEDYERMAANNSEYVTFTDARIKPPPPSCDCAKRNGLQDQCPRPECTPPTPQCLATNPGPCCPLSLGLTAEEAARGWGPAGATRNASSGYAGSSRGMASPAGAPPIVCFCEATSANMPSGKKYICCPAPILM